ncbi:hypothetical protein AKO1_011617 [Acrasis kona]|uniref:Succinate dehydrogenase subunit 4 n=1 Tax=Acrasis kona TaxID=1008807 RepID=A0AAW2Z434_9EUKA
MNRSLQGKVIFESCSYSAGISPVARRLLLSSSNRPARIFPMVPSSRSSSVASYVDHFKHNPPVDTVSQVALVPVVAASNPSLLLVDLYFAIATMANYTEYNAFSIWLDYIKRKRQFFICLTDALLKLIILYWVFG